MNEYNIHIVRVIKDADKPTNEFFGVVSALQEPPKANQSLPRVPRATIAMLGYILYVRHGCFQ